MLRRLLPLTLFLATLAGCAVDPGTEPGESEDAITNARELRMNELQVKATHNSYHKAKFFFPSKSLNYNHKPLDEQLERQGVRAFELDLHYDAKGKRFDVYHVDDDRGTTCDQLVDCLRVIKRWSDGHLGHAPIVIQLETKDTFATVDGAAYYDTLEKEIRSIWPADRLVTPDLVRAGAPTLREAVTTRGWPVLRSVRGRVMFTIAGSDEHARFYTRNGTNLDGRVLFVSAPTSVPYAAFTVIDDPEGAGDAIRAAVRDGFIDRTRADADLKEPKKNDRSRLEAALASGAQLVSTDFPAKDPNYVYVVDIPGGTPSRCNPILAVPGCTSTAIEDRGEAPA